MGSFYLNSYKWILGLFHESLMGFVCLFLMSTIFREIESNQNLIKEGHFSIKSDKVEAF